MLVQLKFASLPAPFGAVAVHYWFTVSDPRTRSCDRWEVWQRKNCGGASVGHLHCNLKQPDAAVGGGPPVLAAQWDGSEAFRLKTALETADRAYPFCHRYLPWPGPNSNTFVAWVLRRAGIDFRLSWKAIGKDYA